MHTRAAVAVFDAETCNKIVTGKVTRDRSMSRPFPTVVPGVLCRSMPDRSFLNAQPRHSRPAEYITKHHGLRRDSPARAAVRYDRCLLTVPSHVDQRGAACGSCCCAYPHH